MEALEELKKIFPGPEAASQIEAWSRRWFEPIFSENRLPRRPTPGADREARLEQMRARLGIAIPPECLRVDTRSEQVTGFGPADWDRVRLGCWVLRNRPAP